LGLLGMSKPHYIKPNKTTAFPQRLLFIDTETTESFQGEHPVHVMRIAWSCYIRFRGQDINNRFEKWVYHTDREKFCEYIETLTYDKSPLWIIASNTAFDLAATGFIGYFTRKKWKLSFYTEKHRNFILSIKNKTRSIRAIAIQNYLPTSIKKLGKLIGKEKLDVDVFTEDTDLLCIYCFRDVEILLEGYLYFLRFVKEYDLGGMAYTLAGQAMKGYRHRFMPEKILIHASEEVGALERSGYFGGRCECFTVGEMPIQKYIKLDVNSMYPYVMSKFEYPARIRGFIQPHNLDMLKKCIKWHCSTSRVLINTDEPIYPRYIDDKCCFPVGTFWATLNTRALKYAFAHNHVKDIAGGVYYDKAFLFKEFINEFWKVRKKAIDEGNEVLKGFIKLLLNSLYGKWAEQHPILIDKKYHKDDTFYVENWYNEKTKEYGQTLIMFHEERTYTGKRDTGRTFTSIAAHVTEDARMYLWGVIKRAGLNRMYYCDTDSIVVSEKTYNERLQGITGLELGQWKVEDTTEHLVLHTLKDYEFGDKIVLKGIPRDNRDAKAGIYYTMQSMSLKTLAAKQILDGAVLQTVPKKLTREYTKGIVTQGGLIKPFRLSETIDADQFPLSAW